MIPDDLRRALVDKLMGVPLVGVDDNSMGRTALLAGIPNRDYFMRNHANAYGDVTLLVVQLEESFGPTGEWRLLQLVDNALPTVLGTNVGKRLREITEELKEVEKGTRPVHVHPAEMAQVHLFDLRQPVITCIGLLPPTPEVSGFVLATPTQRLLGHFCRSLQVRGAGLVWSRDQLATMGPPLVIDPIHTTVPVVLDKTDKVASLLSLKHVLWPIYVNNATDAAVLWQRLEAAFDKTFDHHLLIAFGMPAGTDAPAGMIRLPSPKFTSQDVLNWINDIGSALAWKEPVVKRWASMILVGCAGNNPNDLPIELVYEQLEWHSGLVAQNRTQGELMHALDDLQ